MLSPLVSVIIITYNNESHVKRTIESLESLSYSNWNSIIVDNSSTDNTVTVIKSTIKSNSKFKFFAKQNEGPSAARNFGFAKISSDTKYVFFLDGDDYLREDALTKLVNYMEQRQEVGLLGCQFERIDQYGKYIGRGFRSRWVPGKILPRMLKENESNTPFVTFFCATGQGPFALFRRSVLEQTNLYTESFWSHEDSDIFCQMALVADVHYVSEYLYFKREHSNNLTKVGNKNYDLFRDKWDNYKCSNTEKQRLIDSAKNYYYRSHCPWRDLKVGIKAYKEFVSSPSMKKLKWAVYLTSSGIKGFLYGEKYYLKEKPV